MRLSSISLRNFKRFTDTRIQDLPAEARLIVLAGPNGSGKSSLFDGIKTWHWANGGASHAWDESYGSKAGSPSMSWNTHVQIEFHEPLPSGPEERKKLVYIRSAFRNEADFNVSSFSRLASPLDSARVNRMVDNDVSVSDNYQRLIMASIDGIYSDEIADDTTKGQLRERIIGRVRRGMEEIFPDLLLDGVGSAGTSASMGTFYFSKGASKRFLYKNLSAGEKAAFDLILDAVVKSEYFNNTIWCVDEPETHLNTKIQGALLQTLIGMMPEQNQLILATHSIGFMRKAWELASSAPNSVVFVDMQDRDFDQAEVLVPTTISRDFWSRTLNVALDDLAHLMAPEHIVLCEGKPLNSTEDSRAEFDAVCYRTIFRDEFPRTDFMSVGNSHAVTKDRLELGRAIQTIAAGTRLTRIIDRDILSAEEIADYRAQGIRALSRRNIEAFLLDDEIIIALCNSVGQPGKIDEALKIKANAMAESIARDNDPDDWKKAAPQIHQGIRRLLLLTASGSDWNAFARHTLAPLMTPETTVYQELRNDIFGEE